MDDVLQHIEPEIPGFAGTPVIFGASPTMPTTWSRNVSSRAIAKIHTWQPGTNLRAWLFVILRNCHINEIRREQRMVSLEDESPATSPR